MTTLDNNINSITLVTAFFDIGRESWNSYQRTPEYYLESFNKMVCSYLYQKIIVFIDDKYMNNPIITKIINKPDKNKIFVPINMDWLYKNTDSWKKNNISQRIMDSEEYKTLLSERISRGYPENIYSEYNTINHSKIDFIKYSIDNNLINESELICWCDFGYYSSILHNNPSEYPESSLDLNKFNLTKLNFFIMNEIDEKDTDMTYTLLIAKEIFTGSFFAGSTKLMLELHELYHICLDELYRNNISDDDQHVYLKCYLKNRDIFQLFLSKHKWPQVLTAFQTAFQDRLEIVKQYIKSIRFGVFAEIGVCRGSLSEIILTNNCDSKLYCVDPYLSYADYDDACNNEVGDNLYASTKTRLTTLFNDRVEFIREFSDKAIKYVPDELDFVYIDGNHKCEYVLIDLELWYNKLKPGGIMICDDAVDTNEDLRDENGDVFIRWNHNSYGKYGVIAACIKFTNNKNISYCKLKNQIVIIKPLTNNK